MKVILSWFTAICFLSIWGHALSGSHIQPTQIWVWNSRAIGAGDFFIGFCISNICLMFVSWLINCVLSCLPWPFFVYQGLHQSIPSCCSICYRWQWSGKASKLNICIILITSAVRMRWGYNFVCLWFDWFDWTLHFKLQVTVGLDGKKLEPESNVLLASIENMQYAVTLDVLHMVFFCDFVNLHSWVTMCFHSMLSISHGSGLFSFWTCTEDCHVWQEWRGPGIDSVPWLVRAVNFSGWRIS